MGAQNSFTCDKCGYTVTTSGLWEFYRDAGGVRKPYGHPVPASLEAEKSGIWGLSANLYCPDCDRVFDLIVVEFKEPTDFSLDVWMGRCEPKEEYKKKDAVKCPECGKLYLILGPEGAPELPCPKCEGGVLFGMQDWIS